MLQKNFNSRGVVRLCLCGTATGKVSNFHPSEDILMQRFSTAGPRPGTGPWHQLYRAARGSPGICNFNFLSNFHE